MLVASPSFGARLKQLREAAELSQYELAKRSGVSAANLSRIEEGDRDPQWRTVVKLARALKVSVSDFDVDESPDQSPPPPNRRGKK